MTAKILPFRTNPTNYIEEENRLIEELQKVFANCEETPPPLDESDLLLLGYHLPIDEDNNQGE